jgi:prepilin-type N-terminal cleavage/methylation domain-containing protein
MRIARARAFTLIEVSLAMVIVGVGVLGMMQLLATCTTQNRTGSEITVATLLAENLRETMAGLPLNDPIFGSSTFGAESSQSLSSYDDVDDFDGITLNPPIDAFRRPITELDQYTQIVSVDPIRPSQLSTAVSKSTYTGAVRVRVRVMFRSDPSLPLEEVHCSSWIRMDQ